MPLKGIPMLLSPELLYTLARMGHGDEMVLADAHFPTSNVCKEGGAVEIRADGLCIPELLTAILKLFPLDTYDENPVILMELCGSDKAKGLPVPIWDKYKQIVNASENREVQTLSIDRFDFYDRAKKSFAIVHTGETAQYGNIILKKGLVLS
ncbi:fucose mutarotase-like [Tubulanus polymorphus]|uniref:fucose mutarotase-like n=1 Tax=Tubulanus polymorphus TaxID=672921 RepID=UPI003DA4840F